MMTQRHYGVSRTRLVDGVTVVDEVHVMDAAALVAAARRVCDRDHLHDTADQAQACNRPPGAGQR